MSTQAPPVIYVCDDDDGILDVMTIVLEEAGFTVIQKTDGRAVMADIGNDLPDLLLVDLWMPTVGGEELTKKIKSNQELAHIPVIIISANRNTETIATAAGADGFLAKPFDIDELVALVRKFV